MQTGQQEGRSNLDPKRHGHSSAAVVNSEPHCQNCFLSWFSCPPYTLFLSVSKLEVFQIFFTLPPSDGGVRCIRCCLKHLTMAHWFGVGELCLAPSLSYHSGDMAMCSVDFPRASLSYVDSVLISICSPCWLHLVVPGDLFSLQISGSLGLLRDQTG